MGYDINYENGNANGGDEGKIKALMQRAEAGGEFVIGFIGGSITQGSVSSTPQTCYAYRVYEWWQRTFPQSKFTYVNAGVGSTTSEFGAGRVKEDLLSYSPDFVMVEFSVNDKATEHFMETYEGLVRQILSADSHPAVMLLHNVEYDTGANAQVMHAKVARRYGLPAVSVQSTVFPEIVAGRIERPELSPDGLHPNDAGHEILARLVTYRLEKIKNAAPTSDERQDMPLPAPLSVNAYENARYFHNRNIEPEHKSFITDTRERNGCADCFTRGWTAGNVGDTISFTVHGSGVAVMYRRCVAHPNPIAEVTVDGEHAVRLDANFDETWGDLIALAGVTEHGECRDHEVEVHILEAHDDDAAPFYLIGLVVSQ
ncbi:MAG: SGNH/GDSL hydrolase family protein [Clostridiales bacterium]|nr:SGNH/GDSL hydrolase family protein [Clostridiales bacterium]